MKTDELSAALLPSIASWIRAQGSTQLPQFAPTLPTGDGHTNDTPGDVPSADGVARVSAMTPLSCVAVTLHGRLTGDKLQAPSIAMAFNS